MPEAIPLPLVRLDADSTLANTPQSMAVASTREIHRNPLFAVTQDTIDFTDGVTTQRDYLDHVGSVAVVALTEDHDVVLVNQYRHPVRARLWELPAGVRDLHGEHPATTAQRELAEETGLRARSWRHLIDVHLSPGCSSELISIFAAWDLSPIAEEERAELQHEEATLRCALVPLDRLLNAIEQGHLTNASLAVGILTVARLLTQGTLRHSSSPQGRP